MLARCLNPNNQRWADYGGRGIRVCDEWRTDFMEFYRHIGARPSAAHSIERMDTDDDYRPGNVRWATDVEQNNNKRTNVIVDVNGVPMTIAELARSLGLSWRCVAYRVKQGWPYSALTQPSKRGNE